MCLPYGIPLLLALLSSLPHAQVLSRGDGLYRRSVGYLRDALRHMVRSGLKKHCWIRSRAVHRCCRVLTRRRFSHDLGLQYGRFLD